MILPLCLALVAPPAPARPKLVVVITVDQLRADYLDSWKSQLTGGLGQLAAEGAVFADGYQDHAVTETAPGHSTILSGLWPAHTGIIRNSEGVQDSAAALLDVAALPRHDAVRLAQGRRSDGASPVGESQGPGRDPAAWARQGASVLVPV